MGAEDAGGGCVWAKAEDETEEEGRVINRFGRTPLQLATEYRCKVFYVLFGKWILCMA